MKFLPRGASEYTPPPPSPEKCLWARNGGRGGGVYNFSLEVSTGNITTAPEIITELNSLREFPTSLSDLQSLRFFPVCTAGPEIWEFQHQIVLKQLLVLLNVQTYSLTIATLSGIVE